MNKAHKTYFILFQSGWSKTMSDLVVQQLVLTAFGSTTGQGFKSGLQAVRESTANTLPGTVLSLRDGWQWTCSSGAIVSGLLAGAAGQTIGLFKSSPIFMGSSEGLKSFALTMCYAALILNVGSTISSFVMIDTLGEMGFRASCRADELDEYNDMGLGTFLTNKDDLLIKFGASSGWKWMVYHWLCTFYLGIVSLAVAVLTYVLVQEELVPKVVTSVLLGLTILPSTYFLFLRPFIFDRSKTSNLTKS